MKIILLPGLNGTKGLFEPLIRVNPSNIDVDAISLPNNKSLSYNELTDHIMKELEKIQSDYIIIGESFSGPLALLIAANNVEQLKGIILVASFIQTPKTTIKYIPWNAVFKLAKPFFQLSSGFSIISKELKNVSSTVLANRMYSICNVNVEKELKKCQVPLAYFIGKYDLLVAKRNVNTIRSIRPDMEIIEFSTQHFLLQAAPKQAWNSILEFVDEVSTSNCSINAKHA